MPDPGGTASEWARSGAMALTGPADGSPSLAPGAPATAIAEAMARFAAVSATAPESLPTGTLLGERAAAAGHRRRAPRSVGGSFRSLAATDGWLGISLPRSTDLELVPALVERAVEEPWSAVAEWAARMPVAEAVSRARLLGLAAAAVAEKPPRPRRKPVERRGGGPRPHARRGPPLVIDFTSLWAGPLCAHLLGLAGARIVKVESSNRPDGARFGPTAFYDLLHAGHASVALDFGSPDAVAALRCLLRRADVVLEASRPRALARLGVDADEYVDAGVVWAGITAYGRRGRDADSIGFGDDVAAAAGLTAIADGVPYPVGDAIADPLTGAHAAAEVAAALRLDRGALLDISMFDVAVAAASRPGEAALVVGDQRQGWMVETDAGRVSVAAPSIRRCGRRAASLGADTRSVFAGCILEHE
ncbi:MAG TPA: CoA transferase [Polyangia bacterium]|nr:CoA transferase [Polyangia bacterium]